MKIIFSKRKLILCILVLSFNILKAQYLTLDDIINIQQHDVGKVKGFFSRNGWDFYSSKIDIEKYIGHKFEYNEIGWVYEYNQYSETGLGWAYLLQKDGYENIFIYNTSKLHFIDLENAIKSRFIFIETKVDNNELISIYKNIKGIEFWCITKKPTESDTYDDNSSSGFYAHDKTFNFYYTIILLNKIDLEKRIEENKKEEDYKALIENGNSSFDSENYINAKKYFQDALLIKPTEDYPKGKLVEIDVIIENNRKYDSIIKIADNSFRSKKYLIAKELYKEALNLKPYQNYVQSKLSEVNQIITFLKDRESKIYNYQEINNNEYEIYTSFLIKNIKSIYRNYSSDFSAKIVIIIKTDTLGKVFIKTENISSSNQIIVNKIDSVAKSKKIEAAFLYNYPVNSKTEFSIKLEFVNQVIKVKKFADKLIIADNFTNYYSDINSLITTNPNGYYKIGIYKKTINYTDFSNNKIIKYKSFGGPSSALLSLILPGLGDYLVTGGEKGFLKSPFGTTLTVYGLVGIGIGFQYLSNQNYNKYMNAVDQAKIDKYYNIANEFHHCAMITGGTGVLIWALDVLWVTKKGINNKKASKEFRNQFSLNYNPIFNSTSFRFTKSF